MDRLNWQAIFPFLTLSQQRQSTERVVVEVRGVLPWYGKHTQTRFGAEMCVTDTITQVLTLGKDIVRYSSAQNTGRRSVVTTIPTTNNKC